MGTDDPGDQRAYPFLVAGMPPLHKPGTSPGKNATLALRGLSERGHPAGWCAGDRAYSNALPEDFQLPAQALGYKVVFDYRMSQLGRQGSFGGSIQVEGTWYCPSMPETLVDASLAYRRAEIDEATYQELLQARKAYRLRPHGLPDAEGHVRLMCPASGTSPTARCELKPSSMTYKTRGKTKIHLTPEVKQFPPKICVQQSMTFPPENGAKLAQNLSYGDPEWAAVYHALRSTIEGFNGYAKDGSFEALADPTRRRVRGVAAQSVFVALLVFAANVRKIRSFLELAVVDNDGTVRLPRPRRRQTKSITTFDPRRPAAGPDPPLAS